MNEILIEPDMHDLIEHVDSIELDHPSMTTLETHLELHQLLAPRESFRTKLPIGADCVQSAHAVHFSGLRPLNQIDLQVIHDEEAMTALAAASWFQNPNSGGSATYCIDEYTCFRTLADNKIPWGAPGANYHGLHYEQAGYASWKTALWKGQHRDTIRRTAWKVARDARRYGIAPRWLTPQQLEKTRNGITSHAICSHVFGGTHHDPGTGYPVSFFMYWVHYYYSKMAYVRPVA